MLEKNREIKTEATKQMREYQNGDVSTQETRNKERSNISGELTFDDKVIQKIIGIALEEIDGLLTVDGGFFSNIAEKLVNTDNITSGIDTEVGKKEVAVDMDVVVEYNRDIETIYQQMKKIISEQVNKMTHLNVIEVNVNVVDIKTQKEYEEDSESVQDKLTKGMEKTGNAASKGVEKAKDTIQKEPRVE